MVCASNDHDVNCVRQAAVAKKQQYLAALFDMMKFNEKYCETFLLLLYICVYTINITHDSYSKHKAAKSLVAMIVKCKRKLAVLFI